MHLNSENGYWKYAEHAEMKQISDSSSKTLWIIPMIFALDTEDSKIMIFSRKPTQVIYIHSMAPFFFSLL